MDFIAQLQKHFPSIYIHAVDMAARGETARHIANVIAGMVEAKNEQRAISGMRVVEINIPQF